MSYFQQPTQNPYQIHNQPILQQQPFIPAQNPIIRAASIAPAAEPLAAVSNLFGNAPAAAKAPTPAAWFKNTFGTQNSGVSGTSEFLNSNSAIAKVSFLLFALIAFFILMRFGISIMSWILGNSNSPKLITGMVDAKHMLTFPQDPSMSGAKPIPRSDNQRDGIEFSWSVWIFIDDLNYGEGKYRHIFHKGNDTMAENGLNFPNNAPGLYIAPNTNALVVMMNTYNVINEEIVVPDIPVNKWVNVIIRCKNTELDVYINGTIAKSHELHGVPKQNYGDVYVAMNGGFSGYIADLWYFNHAIGLAEIQRIIAKEPNTKMTGTDITASKNPNYLSMRWYVPGAPI